MFSKGIDARLFVGAADEALADLTELADVSDVDIPMPVDMADTTTRAGRGWKSQTPTTGDIEITFTLKHSDDTQTQLLLTAARSRSKIALAALSGELATTGSEGPYGHFVVSSLTRNEQNSGVIEYAVSLVLQEFLEWIEDGAEAV